MKTFFRKQRYPVVLAVISGCVLCFGLILKPDHREAQKPTISQTEIARLEKFAQRRNLQGISKYFSDLADEVSAQVVRIRRAGVSGLVWNSEGRIIAARIPDSAPGVMLAVSQAGGDAVPARLVAASPDVPLAVLEASVSGPAQPVRRARVSSVRPGDWLLGVARTPNGAVAFAPATFSGVVQAPCGDVSIRELQMSVPVPDGMAGGGVFDMDGGLLAVIVNCGGRSAAISVDDVDNVLRLAEGAPAALLAAFGMRISSVPKDAPAVSAESGALVSEIRLGRAADRSGLAPGDVIVGCDGAPVDRPDDLYSILLAVPDAPHDIEVRRGRRLVKLTLDANAGAPPGIEFERPPRGFVAAVIPPGTRAYRAGLRSGDRVISIDSRPPVSQAAVERALAETAPPAYVVIERGDRSMGLIFNK
jgi:S1-C subfamily serine protease